MPTRSAYHNAGHAVATALIERDRAAHICSVQEHASRWNAEYEAMSALGSVVAERLFLGVVEPTGAKNDLDNALRHLAVLTPFPGEQAAYVALLNAKVEHLLESHRELIERVAIAIDGSDRNANDIARELVR